MADFNQQVVEEFRADGGTVSTAGSGRNLVLVHHTGARSGTERVTPLHSLPTEEGGWLVAASAARTTRVIPVVELRPRG